jgi:hypothetical protein
MSALRGLFAGVGGAAAYNAYKESDGISSSSIASGLYEAFQRKGAAGMAEVRVVAGVQTGRRHAGGARQRWRAQQKWGARTPCSGQL